MATCFSISTMSLRHIPHFGHAIFRDEVVDRKLAAIDAATDAGSAAIIEF